MERVAAEVDGNQVLVCDLDLGVLVAVKAGVDLRAGGGVRRSDQVEDDLVGDERLTPPVLGDEAEQAVLDPLRLI